MKLEGLLPIGSIVRLKGSTGKAMIMGYAQRMVSQPDSFYDYAGCRFPQGIIGPDKTLFFNQEAVEQVYYVGYMDGKSGPFLEEAEKIIREQREKKGSSENEG